MEKNINSALRETGFSFKKRFGQNFITDKTLLGAIVDGASVSDSDAVVEIGCGAGTLTRALASRAKRVVAYEIDRDLKPYLTSALAGLENVEVVFGDFLKADLKALENTLGEYSVVANLPYYVTTPLVTKILEGSTKCTRLTVMVQEEVAERFCARAGTPEYGAITAGIALHASAKIIMRVGRENFTPRPNVDSAVVRLDVCRGRISVKDESAYKSVVRAAFSSRRKTLANNLSSCFNLSRAACEGLLSGCQIDKMARGETLAPEDFAKLSDALLSLGAIK